MRHSCYVQHVGVVFLSEIMRWMGGLRRIDQGNDRRSNLRNGVVNLRELPQSGDSKKWNVTEN